MRLPWGRGVETVREGQPAQRQVIIFVNDDQIGSGVVDFNPFQGNGWVFGRLILGQLLVGCASSLFGFQFGLGGQVL